MALVLEWFIINLLCFNQQSTVARSFSIVDFKVSISFDEKDIDASSANRKESDCRSKWQRSFINIINNNG